MKSTEIYGFVGWIGSFIVYVLYVVWAFTPETILVSLGISYTPSKLWALAIPSFICMTLLYLQIFYQGLNMVSCKSFDDPYCLQDEFTKFSTGQENSFVEGMPEIYDIPINVVNNCVFYQRELKDKYDTSSRKVQASLKKNGQKQSRDGTSAYNQTSILKYLEKEGNLLSNN